LGAVLWFLEIGKEVFLVAFDICIASLSVWKREEFLGLDGI